MSDAIDWDEVLDEQPEEETFDPLPKGAYTCDVETAEAVTSSTNKPMVKIMFRVTEEGPYKNRTLWTNIVLDRSSEFGMKYTLRKLAGLGVGRDLLRTYNPTAEVIAEMVKGVATIVTVDQKEYNGAMTNDVKGMRAIDGVTVANKPGGAPRPSGSAGPRPSAPKAAPKPAGTAPRPGVPSVPKPAAAAAPRPAPEPAPVSVPDDSTEEVSSDYDEEPF